ncbi:MAG: hypothetical protein PHX21_04980 [bacterium]|nr:hypothetical protein [bacterium]
MLNNQVMAFVFSVLPKSDPIRIYIIIAGVLVLTPLIYLILFPLSSPKKKENTKKDDKIHFVISMFCMAFLLFWIIFNIIYSDNKQQAILSNTLMSSGIILLFLTVFIGKKKNISPLTSFILKLVFWGMFCVGNSLMGKQWGGGVVFGILFSTLFIREFVEKESERKNKPIRELSVSLKILISIAVALITIGIATIGFH